MNSDTLFEHEKLLKLLDGARRTATGKTRQAIKQAIAVVNRVNEDRESRKRDDEKHAALMDIGKNAMSSLAEMVAALNCDYDRLEELREERTALVPTADNNETGTELAEWDEENGEELKALEEAAGECKDRDEAYERIQEDPLSIEVRSGWVTPPIEAGTEPEEFAILLTTGGPAVRIIGEFGTMNSPKNPRLQVQDWFQPWTEYLDADRDVLQTYCEQFYFGE